MEIVRVEENKWNYRELLLLADPSEEIVNRYLSGGELFVVLEDGRAIAEAVVDPAGEVKNLAVVPDRQGTGIGRMLLERLCEHYRGRFECLSVGTAEAGVAYYEKCGFHYSHTVKNFFTDNYPEPILDNGILCVDMIYLKRQL